MIDKVPLGITVHFDVITSASTGAVQDADSAPTFAVYEEDTDTDIGVGGNFIKRTSLTGNYRGSFSVDATAGFEVGKFYNIIASATVDSTAGKCVVKTFRVVPAENVVGVSIVDLGYIDGDPATPDENPDVNVIQWKGGIVPIPNETGVPIVDMGYVDGGVATPEDQVDSNLTHVLGTALNETAAGRLAAALENLLDVATPVLTAEMYGLSPAVNNMLAALAGGTPSGQVVTGTGNTTTQFATDIVGRTDNFIRNAWLLFTSGDLNGEAQPISDYSTDGTFTVSSPFTATPDDNDDFVIIGRNA